MKLPELGEGWSWNITQPTICCTNPKCCGENSDGHPKVRVELLLHNEVRHHGLIDIEFYGDNGAVIQRARAMLDSMAREQMQSVGCGILKGDKPQFCPDCWEQVEDGIPILTYAEKIEAYQELRACCPDGTDD